MYANTVSKNMFTTLQGLMNDPLLNQFILVGGTALSLQLGHRMSVDIDLFCPSDFDKPLLNKHLASKFNFRLPSISDIALRGFIGNVKVDFVYYQNGFLNAPLLTNEIRMADLEDISAMKLEAIANVQNRAKDYVDVAFLSEHLSLKKMLDLFTRKFDLDRVFVLRSLSSFSQVDLSEGIFLLNGNYEWATIEQRIKEMIKSPETVFGPLKLTKA
jgi:Nucleotidyl transferase AbiEii toxin, Type IV TA system